MVAEMVEACRAETVHTKLGKSPTPDAQCVETTDLLPVVENALLAFEYVAELGHREAWSDSEYNALVDVGEALRHIQWVLQGSPGLGQGHGPDETTFDPNELFGAGPA